MKDEFKIIPDFPKYEINPAGVIRNRRTKVICSVCGDGRVYLYCKGGKYAKRSPRVLAKTLFKQSELKPLSSEVFGRPKQRQKPCTLQRDGQRIHFYSLTDAARFLQKGNYYALDTLKGYFRRRSTTVLGWQVTYFEEAANDAKNASLA